MNENQQLLHFTETCEIVYDHIALTIILLIRSYAHTFVVSSTFSALLGRPSQDGV